MTHILGISAFYHDSAACLLQDGRIVAAAQEERFSRRKHDPDFPTRAVEYCLKEAGIGIAELDHVAFYDKPVRKFDRLLETWVGFAPRGLRQFLKALPVSLREKLQVPRQLDRGLKGEYRRRFVFFEHHESHAASAFFPSPFEEAAVLTIDGVGEWTTASIGHGRGRELRLLQELRFPHSLGLVYTAFTTFCGFKANSGEYKLMGLAPYGSPRYADFIRDEIFDLKEDGSFRVDQSYFAYGHGLMMTSDRLASRLGGPPRVPESPLGQREMDIAASIQVVTEEIVLRMARRAHAVTGSRNLCMAGGVALNCVANGRILREGPFERLWIQPAAGDAGGALGAAYLVHHDCLKHERQVDAFDAMQGGLLGPRFSDEDIAAFLKGAGARFVTAADDDALADRSAELLAEGKVVGLFQGRMEFGPRALGARSIIGDPRSPRMQRTMNLKIKFRESFRPFAPAVLADRAHEWFAIEKGVESPYMLIVAPVAPSRCLEVDEGLEGLARLDQLRSTIPAVTHVDRSARVQTVDARRNPTFHRILTRFEARTGCPVLVNTSFNVRGEPIVGSPEDALRCFMATDMDVLVLGRHVLLKDEQEGVLRPDTAEFIGRFSPD